MKPEKTKRELKLESIADLEKGKLYLQKELLVAPNSRAHKLFVEAIAITDDVIARIKSELENLF